MQSQYFVHFVDELWHHFMSKIMEFKVSYSCSFAVNQPHPKRCIAGYLFPMPIAVGPFPHPSFDATTGEL